MDKYKDIIKKYEVEEDSFKNAFVSFLSGGVLGIGAEALVRFYMNFLDKELSLTLMSITFILLASILTGFNIFDDLIEKFRFGLIIPITGFAHSMTSALMDYKKDGMITGLGANVFKLAGSVILYGTISACALALLRGVLNV